MSVKRIVAISDTHQLQDQMKYNIPDGDILIHAGDLCNSGSLYEVEKFSYWLFTIKPRFSNIIVISGNHDWAFQLNKPAAKKYITDTGAIYLENEEVIIEGLKFWGSPATRYFCNWAFNYRESQLKVLWENIPEDVNVLITHSMPLGKLDKVLYPPNESVGEVSLPNRIKKLKQLSVYIGGHLHLEGCTTLFSDNVLYVNAAICDDDYVPCRKPVSFDIDVKTKKVTKLV